MEAALGSLTGCQPMRRQGCGLREPVEASPAVHLAGKRRPRKLHARGRGVVKPAS